MTIQKISDKALNNKIIKSDWLAGWTPEDGQNPWKFYEDGSFKTLKDSHGGKWWVENSILKLRWTTVDGYAEFVVNSLSNKSLYLSCINSGWEFMRSWKLHSTESTRYN